MKARVTRVLESLYPQRFQLAIKHYNGALPAELTIPEPIIKEPSLIKEIQIKSGLFSIKLNKEYFPENAHIELSPKFKHGELIWVCRASDNILKYTPSYCEKDF